MSLRTQPSFTILINNYNYGRFLATAIQSALDQTWPKVQVLVVDDGSDDESLEIANQFVGPNYRVISKSNGGQNSAIAHALAYVEGDYTIILDSDDWLKPEACETIALKMGARRPNGVHYQLKKTSLDGRTLGHYPALPFVKTNQRKYIRRHGTIPSAPTSGNAYRSDFLREAFSFILPQSLYSDGYLAQAAGWTEDTLHIDSELGIYTVHGSNVSTSAGQDDYRRRRNNDFAIDHSRNLFNWLAKRGLQPMCVEELFEAYIWQRILYFKLTQSAYPDYSYADCRRFGTKRFIAASHLGLIKQIKNVIFLWVGSFCGELRNHLVSRP